MGDDIDDGGGFDDFAADDITQDFDDLDAGENGEGLDEIAQKDENVESDDEDAEPEESKEEEAKAPLPEAGIPEDATAKINMTHRKVIIVDPEDRITSNVLQQMEMSGIISKRAAQIERNSQVFTDVTGMHDPIEMAEKELMDRKCPLILRRRIRRAPTGDGNFDLVCEDWKVREMTLPTPS